MIKFTNIEERFIKRLFQLKPDVSGKELINYFNWMNDHNLKGIETNFGKQAVDDWILGNMGYGIKYERGDIKV